MKLKRGKRPRKAVFIIIALVIATGFAIWYFCLDIEQKVTIRAEKDVYPLGITEISVVFRNASLQQVTLWDGYALERLVDGEWLEVDDLKLNIRWTLSGRTLYPWFPPFEMTPYVGMYSYFDEPFDYRIVFEISTAHLWAGLIGEYTSTRHTIYYYFAVE